VASESDVIGADCFDSSKESSSVVSSVEMIAMNSFGFCSTMAALQSSRQSLWLLVATVFLLREDNDGEGNITVVNFPSCCLTYSMNASTIPKRQAGSYRCPDNKLATSPQSWNLVNRPTASNFACRIFRKCAFRSETEY